MGHGVTHALRIVVGYDSFCSVAGTDKGFFLFQRLLSLVAASDPHGREGVGKRAPWSAPLFLMLACSSLAPLHWSRYTPEMAGVWISTAESVFKASA